MSDSQPPPRPTLVATIEEFDARCRTERVRFEWPGNCSWCGGRHSKESNPGGHVCVLCHMPHMGYCFAPTTWAPRLDMRPEKMRLRCAYKPVGPTERPERRWSGE